MATINQITVNSTTYDLAVSAANVSGTVANATTATKLGTATKGSATQPIYLSSGAPTACTYSLAKSVPADAKFTDTTYSTFVKSGSSAAAGLVPKPSTTAGTTKYLREDGTWGTPSTSYTLPTASSSTLGGVKVGTGLGISSGTLSVSYGTTATTACNGNDSRLSDSRTPKEHAATATTYGAGTASNYGHVKLSDSYTTSGGTAAYGVAASSYALVTAYNTLNSNLSNILVGRVCDMGSKDFTITGSETQVYVNFTTPFKYTPLVFISISRSGYATETFGHVSSRSTESVAVVVKATNLSSNTGCVLQWIAFGYR